MDENNKPEAPADNHVLSCDSVPQKEEEVTSHGGHHHHHHHHHRHKSRHQKRRRHKKSGSSRNGNGFGKFLKKSQYSG